MCGVVTTDSVRVQGGFNANSGIAICRISVEPLKISDFQFVLQWPASNYLEVVSLRLPCAVANLHSLAPCHLQE
jgi:hypothetical protein